MNNPIPRSLYPNDKVFVEMTHSQVHQIKTILGEAICNLTPENHSLLIKGLDWVYSMMPEIPREYQKECIDPLEYLAEMELNAFESQSTEQ